MTPHERELIDDLFDRLAKLETAPRDSEAERAIIEGLRRAPNAVYALVQTALVQDEALKRADARIRELSGEGGPEPQGGGFLDTMRNALMGGGAGGRTSVPSVGAGNPSGGPDPRWNQGGTSQGGGFQAGPGYAPGSGSGRPRRPRRYARDLHGLPRDVQAEDCRRDDVGVLGRPSAPAPSIACPVFAPTSAAGVKMSPPSLHSRSTAANQERGMHRRRPCRRSSRRSPGRSVSIRAEPL